MAEGIALLVAGTAVGTLAGMFGHYAALGPHRALAALAAAVCAAGCAYLDALGAVRIVTG